MQLKKVEHLAQPSYHFVVLPTNLRENQMHDFPTPFKYVDIRYQIGVKKSGKKYQLIDNKLCVHNCYDCFYC